MRERQSLFVKSNRNPGLFQNLQYRLYFFTLILGRPNINGRGSGPYPLPPGKAPRFLMCFTFLPPEKDGIFVKEFLKTCRKYSEIAGIVRVILMVEKENRLEILKECAPYFQQVLGGNAVFGIADTQKYISIIQGERFKLPVHPGDEMKTGSIADTCIKSRTKIIKKVPKEVLGIPYIGMGIPINDKKGNTIGVIIVGKPVEIEEEVNLMTTELSTALDNITIISSNLTSASEQLAATAHQLSNNATSIQNNIKNMDAIVSLIKEVSDQTHLLGLNAAIEAARAGDLGRGFNVVAGEIRKLAGRTQTSTKEISANLKNVQEEVIEFTTHIHEVSAVSQQQSASVLDITSYLEKIRSMAEKLSSIAQRLVK